MHPQNAREMPDAGAEVIFGDPNCGDALKLYIKVKYNCI